MRLNSVRELKKTITANPHWITARSEDRAGMAIGVAVGTTADDYRIAIRARSEAEVDQQLLDQIRSVALHEVDLKYTGPLEITPVQEPLKARRLEMGASTGHYRCSAGTIGFFASRAADGALGIVSNNHVLAAQDTGVDGDEILHPGPADFGRSPNDVVARLAGDYPRLRAENQTVDCAFARLVRGATFDPLAVSATETLRTTIAVPEMELEVEKIGRTTQRTRGRITAIDLDFFDVNYSFGLQSFYGQIEIESIDATPFCRPGDSGSLVFTRDCEPVGLLFLGTRAGGRYNSGRGYANPIGDVLRALGVTFAS
jgi:hypothetical protein